MKKLMVMLSAVATAFGLYAATSVQTSFEGKDAGVAEGKFTPATAGWTWAGDPLTLGVYDAEKDPAYDYSAGGTERRTGWAAGNTQDQYLKLETGKDTLACEREVEDDNYVIDQLVKFTGFEEMQETFAEGTKIAIWQAALESDDDAEGVTNKNLYVSVGSLTGNVALSLGEYDPEVWHRLTIKSIKNIMANGNARTGFVIYIDGKQVASADDAAKSLFVAGNLTAEAKNLMAKGQLFPAMVADEVETLASVGYQGIGAIDDVIIDQLGPDFVQSVDFVLAGVPANATVDSVVDSNGKTLTLDPETGKYTADAGVTVTVTLAANKGWFFGNGAKALEIEGLVPSAELDITKGGEVDVGEVAAAAQKGDTDFLTLQAAINDTTVEADVELLGAVELAAPITAPAGAEFTLNLCEFGITSAEDFTGGDYLFELGNATAIVKNGTITTDKRAFHVVGGDLTVDRLTANCGGRVIGAYAGSAVEVDSEASLTTSGDDVTIFVRGNTVDKSTDGTKGALVVYGTVANEFEGDQNAISGNGWDWVGVGITIAGTVFTTGTGAAIYKPQAGTLTITGDETSVTGATGIYAKSGAVVINGGYVYASGETADPEVNNNGITSTGDALVLEKLAAGAGGYSNDLTCQITGGKLESDNGYAVRSWAREGITALAGFIDENALFKGLEMPTDYIVEASGYEAKWSEPDEDGYVTAEWEVAEVLPEASVAVMDPLPEGYDTAVTFTATDKGVGYDDWTATFKLVSNVAIGEGEIALGGQYAATFGDNPGTWVDIPFPGCEAGQAIDIMAIAGVGQVTVADVFDVIKTFNCGVKNIALKNDATFSLELVISDPEGVEGDVTLCNIDDLAVAKKEFTVTATGGANATVTVNPEKGVVDTEVTITATAKENYTYEGVDTMGWAKAGETLTKVVTIATEDNEYLVPDAVEAKPANITVTVKKTADIASVTYKGEELEFNDNVATLTLPADTTAVTLTLAAVDTIKIPVFTFAKGADVVGWSATGKETSYDVTADDTLNFAAEEANVQDPAITDKAAADAVADAAKTDEAKAKVTALTTGEGAIGGKALANWINTKAAGAVDTALAGDYVKASVALDVEPITENTEIEIKDLSTGAAGAMTFKVDINDVAAVEAIKDMVEASSDLGAWDAHKLETTATYDAGKVTITPKAATDKAFMKVVIPQDAK